MDEPTSLTLHSDPRTTTTSRTQAQQHSSNGRRQTGGWGSHAAACTTSGRANARGRRHIVLTCALHALGCSPSATARCRHCRRRCCFHSQRWSISRRRRTLTARSATSTSRTRSRGRFEQPPRWRMDGSSRRTEQASRSQAHSLTSIARCIRVFAHFLSLLQKKAGKASTTAQGTQATRDECGSEGAAIGQRRRTTAIRLSERSAMRILAVLAAFHSGSYAIRFAFPGAGAAGSSMQRTDTLALMRCARRACAAMPSALRIAASIRALLCGLRIRRLGLVDAGRRSRSCGDPMLPTCWSRCGRHAVICCGVEAVDSTLAVLALRPLDQPSPSRSFRPRPGIDCFSLLFLSSFLRV